MITCYAPLQLWGPALLVLTWAYYRRRVSAHRGRGFSAIAGSGGAGSGSPS